MRHGNRKERTRHAIEQYRRRAHHFHQVESRFKLLATIAHKPRPMLRARDEALHRGEHLTTVAHTQRETIRPLKETLKLRARGLMEQNGLGPPFARTQHVSIGEPAARDEPLELLQRGSPGKQVRHVNVVRLKAYLLEHRSHLGVTVHALLTQ